MSFLLMRHISTLYIIWQTLEVASVLPLCFFTSTLFWLTLAGTDIFISAVETEKIYQVWKLRIDSPTWGRYEVTTHNFK